MKFMLIWQERPTGVAQDFESAQKRMLAAFAPRKIPDNVTVQQFLVRVGEFGGFLLLETTDVLTIHKLISDFPAFQFKVTPVVDAHPADAPEIDIDPSRDTDVDLPFT